MNVGSRHARLRPDHRHHALGQRIRLYDSRITYSLVGGGTGVISTDDVDWTTTTRLNAQRGVRVTLHNSHAIAATQGF